MKTTAGKTKRPQSADRLVIISVVGGRQHIAVRRAPSLKQGLLDYYRETLAAKGHSSPKVVGNVLSVKFKRRTVQYVATEEYQQPHI